jgi:hypothetical protein
LHRYTELVEVSSLVDDEDMRARNQLAELLARVPREVLGAYLAAGIKDDHWVEARLMHVRYGGIVRKGWEHMRQNQVQQALAVVRPYLDTATKYASLHVLYATAVLKDQGRDIWNAVEAAQRYARVALASLHWSDTPADREDARRIGEDSPESVAQYEGGFRAEAMLAQRRTGSALQVLFSVYPGARGHAMPSANPPALAWARTTPAGRGFYAYVVAKSIRSNVIEWFNTLYQSQGYYSGTAREALNAVERWGLYARDIVASDRLPPQFIQTLQNEIEQLLQALNRDRGALAYR